MSAVLLSICILIWAHYYCVFMFLYSLYLLTTNKYEDFHPSARVLQASHVLQSSHHHQLLNFFVRSPQSVIITINFLTIHGAPNSYYHERQESPLAILSMCKRVVGWGARLQLAPPTRDGLAVTPMAQSLPSCE